MRTVQRSVNLKYLLPRCCCCFSIMSSNGEKHHDSDPFPCSDSCTTLLTGTCGRKRQVGSAKTFAPCPARALSPKTGSDHHLYRVSRPGVNLSLTSAWTLMALNMTISSTIESSLLPQRARGTRISKSPDKSLTVPSHQSICTNLHLCREPCQELSRPNFGPCSIYPPTPSILKIIREQQKKHQEAITRLQKNDRHLFQMHSPCDSPPSGGAWIGYMLLPKER
jgi:hypothetical protein